jgi:hypothetical protein
MEYVDCGSVCADCLMAIANDDYSGMSDKQEQLTRAGLARSGQHLIAGDDLGFRRSLCYVCGQFEGGDKTAVGYLVPLKVSVSRIRLNAGGYDSSGRYWGGGAPLYHVASEYDSVNFELRAADRAAAVAEVSRRHPGVGFYRS